jgi:hypothetical protein
MHDKVSDSQYSSKEILYDLMQNLLGSDFVDKAHGWTTTAAFVPVWFANMLCEILIVLNVQCF